MPHRIFALRQLARLKQQLAAGLYNVGIVGQFVDGLLQQVAGLAELTACRTAAGPATPARGRAGRAADQLGRQPLKLIVLALPA